MTMAPVARNGYARAIMRLAIIGSGISGIAAAHTFARLGHEVVVFERSDTIGGVWARAYPGVRLQSVAAHYAFTDYPWPADAGQHPSAGQVLAYLAAAVDAFGLDVRLNHEVAAMTPLDAGWRLTLRAPDGTRDEDFHHVVLATGIYGEEGTERSFPDAGRYGGTIVSERHLPSLDLFDGKRVAVIGFGKTALDLATFAAARGAEVHHVFREPRWLLPRRVFGIHTSRIATTRVSTMMVPAWEHPRRSERILHRWFAASVWFYWKSTEAMLVAGQGLHPFYRDPAVRARIHALVPDQDLTYQLRSAVALAPDDYYPMVRKGRILPRRGEVVGYTDAGLRLADGTEVAAEIVVPALGYRPPSFDLLPAPYRAMMAGDGGTQLYRHVIHPRIPRLAFAGFNHASLHTACVEVAMLWYGAVIAGDLALPSVERMEASTARVAAWKERHVLFEPGRAFGVGNRLHQYLDVLLDEIGVPTLRKRGVFRELTEPYFAADYAGVLDDYLAVHAEHPRPRMPLPFDA